MPELATRVKWPQTRSDDESTRRRKRYRWNTVCLGRTPDSAVTSRSSSDLGDVDPGRRVEREELTAIDFHLIDGPTAVAIRWSS